MYDRQHIVPAPPPNPRVNRETFKEKMNQHLRINNISDINDNIEKLTHDIKAELERLSHYIENSEDFKSLPGNILLEIDIECVLRKN